MGTFWKGQLGGGYIVGKMKIVRSRNEKGRERSVELIEV